MKLEKPVYKVDAVSYVLRHHAKLLEIVKDCHICKDRFRSIIKGCEPQKLTAAGDTQTARNECTK
jgi:hypothetical protein